MAIIISYNKYQHNWYVGELYEAFAIHMQNCFGDIDIIPINELAETYNEPYDTRENSLPSLFNIYNLIVYNTITKKGFAHSLSDYAPVFLDHETALQKLNITTFCFSSNFTNNIFEIYKHVKVKILPSFYILENWNDHEHIELVLRNSDKKNNCYFNGLCYGHRQPVTDCLKANDFFIMKNKSVGDDFLDKTNYYENIAKYEYGLSLNGAAQICYRDLEYFGTKTLCLREKLNIITHDPIIENVHYKTIIDNDTINKIYNTKNYKIISNEIVDKIMNISQEEKQYILFNAYEWFNKNANPIRQIDFLKQIIIENDIL